MSFLRKLLSALFGQKAAGSPPPSPSPEAPREKAPQGETLPGTTLPAAFPAPAGSRTGPASFGEQAVARLVSKDRRRLAWLAYHKPDAYVAHRVPKRGGGERVLHEPCAALKFVQRTILREILDEVILHQGCHGFRPGRSIVTNARAHEGKDMVVCLDIRDFFPTITFPRVFGFFRSLGLPPGDAGLLARLTTWEGRLPQGAPTSPQLANVICRKMDRRLFGLAAAAGAAYTRYADDLTFSGPASILKILPTARRIAAEEGFRIAEEKTRIMRKGSRQKVCGVVVNRKAALPRETRRRIRAVFHRAGQAPAERKGPALPGTSVQGYKALLHMFETGDP
jgi:hypothetical protein